ncbi:MAG: type II secretion system protein [Oscillospiraceae bacterium]|nr:type II secretion system protein [Oscillospiraceae bacterium]
MRNLKTKGFTLVELIVVIAIIGVLAAVLVPAMLGYMRDSKISQANQNAHAVYTAAQAAVTKYCTANGTKSTKNQPFSGSVTTKGQAIGLDVTGGSATLNDFGDYLGDQFIGDFAFQTGASGDTVEYAVWSQDTTTLTVPHTEEDQIAAYKAGTLVGVHPQYPANS